VTGLYLFAAAAGIPLLVWMLLAGGDEGGADDAGGGDGGIGGLMLRLLPLSSIAIVLTGFGVCGLAMQLAGVGRTTTLVCSIAVGLVAGVLNGAAFAYLRRSESTASIGDDELTGKVGRIVLPTAPDRRGRVVVSVGGQQVQMTAIALPDPAGHDLEVGAPVVVVEVRNGVASVARLDPELT
jgi:hypothetical protein